MACCTGYCAAEQFGPKRAKRDLRRYRRRGADKTTRLLLAELRRWPLEGRNLLDVGGGIGVIVAELADTHVASAAMVEASPAYLAVARHEVGLKYGSRPVQRVVELFTSKPRIVGSVLTNPRCFFRIGRTFVSIISQSSPAFPGLLVSSTTHVYMGSNPFCWYPVKGTRRDARRVCVFTLVECYKRTPILLHQLLLPSCLEQPTIKPGTRLGRDQWQ